MEANVDEHQERLCERLPSENRVALGVALAKDASSSTLHRGVQISRHGPGLLAASTEMKDKDMLTNPEGLGSMSAPKPGGPLERRNLKQKVVIGEGSNSGSGTIETGTGNLGRSHIGSVEMEIGETATHCQGEQTHAGDCVETAAFIEGEGAVGEPVSNLVELIGDESSRASAHVEAWLHNPGGEAGSLSGCEQPLESPCPALIARGTIVQEAEQIWSHEAFPETETSNAAGVTLVGETEGLESVPTDDLPALTDSEEYIPSESDPEDEEPPELLPADEDEDSGSEFQMLSLPELIDGADIESDATDDESPAVPGRIRPQQGPAQVGLERGFPLLRADSQRAGHVQGHGQVGGDDGAESEYDDVPELLSGGPKLPSLCCMQSAQNPSSSGLAELPRGMFISEEVQASFGKTSTSLLVRIFIWGTQTAHWGRTSTPS
jgi:hypothetical protein